MLTKTDLQALLEYEAQSPVLSVYLNTDPTKGTIEDYKLQLRSMLKDIDLREDVEVVKEYFDYKYDWRKGRSVAVFSNADEDFFRDVPLAVNISPRARVHCCPHVKPLAALFDTYAGYGVILIDKQQARFFSFHLGELTDEVRISGDEVQRQKHGPGSQTSGRSRGVEGSSESPDLVSQRNMQDAAEKAARFLKTHDVRRVLIGGTQKNVSTFRELLPKSWQSLIVGTFPMSMDAGHDEVQDKALEVGEEAEKHLEEKLLQTIITEAAKGKSGLTRLDDILDAVREGRVQTLVIQDKYRAEGYRCQGCEYMTLQRLETCPFCTGDFEHIEDVVEMAVRTVFKTGGSVKVLEDNQLLAEHGGIAALLRY